MHLEIYGARALVSVHVLGVNGNGVFGNLEQIRILAQRQSVRVEHLVNVDELTLRFLGAVRGLLPIFLKITLLMLPIREAS